MSDDPNEYIAESYHLLVAQVQDTAVREADKQREAERQRALELRRGTAAGLSLSELVNDIYNSDPEKQRAKAEAEDARIQAEAAAAAKAKEPEHVDPSNRFPAPPITAGS